MRREGIATRVQRLPPVALSGSTRTVVGERPLVRRRQRRADEPAQTRDPAAGAAGVQLHRAGIERVVVLEACRASRRAVPTRPRRASRDRRAGPLGRCRTRRRVVGRERAERIEECVGRTHVTSVISVFTEITIGPNDRGVNASELAAGRSALGQRDELVVAGDGAHAHLEPSRAWRARCALRSSRRNSTRCAAARAARRRRRSRACPRSACSGAVAPWRSTASVPSA